MAVTRTNAFTLLTILIRAGALVVVVGFATTSATWLATWLPGLRGEDAAWDWLLLASMALMLLMVGTLWLLADKLARLALARPDGQVFESQLDAGAWQAIAFSTVGLWVAVDHGLGFLRWMVFRFAVRDQWAGFADDQQRDFVLGVIGDIVGVAVGSALLLGARGLVVALHRFRYGRSGS
jgi:hypothetical protein